MNNNLIRVLLQNRTDVFTKPGGDTSLMKATQHWLQTKGFQVDISAELAPDLSNYDVVHLFNISRVHETYYQLKNAKRQVKPVVCSTIYHDYNEFNKLGRHGITRLLGHLGGLNTQERIKNIYRTIKDRRQFPAAFMQFWMGYYKQQKQVLLESDMLILKGPRELEKLKEHFGVDITNYTFIPDGVDDLPKNVSASLFENKYGLKDFVLCVGRVEEVKNQLALLEAVRGTGLKVVLIGKSNPNNRHYCEMVEKTAREVGAVHIEWLDNDELASAYLAARVHVLPSWFETNGLVSMEAGLACCNVVSTSRTYSVDYFGDCVWYCDPSDVQSIREAVLKAYEKPKNTAFRERLLGSFTWDSVSSQLADTYKNITARI